MLQKPQTGQRALLSYALVLPLAGLLTLCTQPDRDQPLNEVGLAKARTATKPVKVEGEIFTVVEEQPKFPGGMAGLGQYIGQNLKYPAAAEKANAEGRVFVRFIVTKSGEITDVKILKGIGFGADEESIRMVSTMPRWIPGKQNGKAVNVQYNLPINFQLEDEDGEKTAFGGAKHFTIDGKKATKEQVSALLPKNILRVDVNKEQETVAITTK